MRLVLTLAMLSVTVSMLFTVNYAGAVTDRTITINMNGQVYDFKISTYEFDQTVSIDVSDSLLNEIVSNFASDKFIFYNTLSKHQMGDSSIEIKPPPSVGKRLEVKFVGAGAKGTETVVQPKPETELAVEMSNIMTDPQVVRVGDEFKIRATVLNSGSETISYSGMCTSPISAEFSSNVDVRDVPVCLAIMEVQLEPGKSITVEGDLSTVWKALSPGRVKATVTFSYWTGGLDQMNMHKVSKDFSFEIMGAPAPGKFPVTYEGKSFDVMTALSNGSVESIDIDPDFVSVLVTLDTSATEDGELVISIPRELLDSKANGSDDSFVVLVDGEEMEYDERNTTSIERELVIPVFAGAGEVEILGSEVIPEFPFGIMAVMGMVIAVVVTTSRFKQFL